MIGTIDEQDLDFAILAKEAESEIVLINIPDGKLYQTVQDAHESFKRILDTFATPEAVADLRQHLVEGRIDGNTYFGECACIFGTLANFLQAMEPDEMPSLVWDVENYGITPAERLFIYIHRGDTPTSNPVAELVLRWLDLYTTGKGQS